MGQRIETLYRILATGRARTWFALGVLTLGFAVSGSEGRKRGAAETGPAPEFPRLVRLPLGSDVSRHPPEGWSHLVVKSVPRLSSGELASLPATAKATATLFRSVIAAQVVGEGSGFRLARVGIGNVMPVGGRELVVSPDGPEEALAELGLVEKMVLRGTEARMAGRTMLSRTPTFALFRAPAVMVVEGRHEEVELFNALLVDPDTGAPSLLTWSAPAGSTAAPGRVLLLPSDFRFDVDLDVKVSRRAGFLPVSWSFAMRSLPAAGTPLPVSGPVARRIEEVGSPEGDAAALEAALRGLIRSGLASR